MDLFSELNRRRIFRTGIFYVMCAWVLIQVADIVLPAFSAADWMLQALIIVCILGFPVALVLAWIYDLTPDGIERTTEEEGADIPSSKFGRKIDFVIIGLLCFALVLMFVDNYVLDRRFAADNAMPPAARSLAVLPFKNRSAAAENAAFFASGVHDDLLTLLSKLSEVRVISRISVDRFKDSELSLKQIAESLGVATIVEGSVQQAGDRVRINVQLVDAKTGQNIWAETYDRELTAVNVFEIQSEIATQIAASLKTRLTPRERSQFAKVPTQNLDAYRAYLLGKERLETLSTQDLHRAVAFFETAIELDPEFASAYIGLADAYIYLVDFGSLEAHEAVTYANPLVERALQIEPDTGEAYVTLGAIRYYELDFVGAEMAYRRALELKPNYVPAYEWYGDLLSRIGRPQEALELLRKGLLLDPLSPGLFDEIADALSALGRFDQALAELAKVIELEPGYQLSYWRVARINAFAFGRLDEAIIWMNKSLEIDPGDAFGFAYVGVVYAALGDLTEADEWISKALELGPNSSFAHTVAAALAEKKGDSGTAVDFSQRIIAAQGNNDYWRAFAVLRNVDIEQGREAEAIARYRRHFPELFVQNGLAIDASNYQAAAGLALLLMLVGDHDHANSLIDETFEFIQKLPRMGWVGYGIVDVQLYAIQGRIDAALSAFREAVDNGWRPIMDLSLASDPSLKALWQEPEFKAILARIDADMAMQLERVRALQSSGEIRRLSELET